jgi:hypothetical protein
MKINKLFILLAIGIFLFSFISAEETMEITYKIQIKPIEYCSNSCASQLITNSTTNQTINQTNCENKCSFAFEIRGLPTDKNKITPIKVNFSEQATLEEISTSGGWLTLSGNYEVSLGNRTDITGINEKLNELNLTASNLYRCQTTLLEYNTNLTKCYDSSGIGTNYTINECTSDKNNLQSHLSDKQTEIDNLNQELGKQKNNKLILIAGAFILGIVSLRYVYPALKDKNIKSDPLNKGKQTHTEY